MTTAAPYLAEQSSGYMWLTHKSVFDPDRDLELGPLPGTCALAEFGTGPVDAIAHLESAVEDVTQAIDDIRSGQREAEHYEQGNRA